MAARVRVWFILTLLLSGCAAIHTPDVRRIALLAPFEGRYREIGYQALYAARMAIAEADEPHLELLAVDDGGTLATAQDRARALAQDPLVEMVLLLGPFPADESVEAELRDSQYTRVIGSWESSLDAAIAGDFTACDDICQLNVYSRVADDPSVIDIRSAAPLPSTEFVESYVAFDQFAPPPLPIAYLTYLEVDSLLRGSQLPDTSQAYRYSYNVSGTLIVDLTE
ncbi:MAG: hypothetical protein AAF125_10145 [Chloroflexota bacterium]